MNIAQGGSLFGAITLQEVLNEDTESGQLIVSSCQSLLLTLSAKAAAERPRVYKVDILPEVKRKDTVYVTLHETCVEELKLSNGMKVDVEIQFQLNRSNFVRMHDAVDACKSSNALPVLFPVTSASGQPHTGPLRYHCFFVFCWFHNVVFMS